MKNFFALLAACSCAALAVSSTGFAADWSAIPFGLAKTKDAGRVQFSIHNSHGDNRSENWSQTVALAELQGLSEAQLKAERPTQIRFTLARPAGRFACIGSARSFDGRGRCNFAPDAGFSAMLANRGVGRPSLRQSFALAMSDFRPETLGALAAAGYPQPTLDQSVALGIFKIAPAYIRGLSSAGYRIGSVDNLVALRIHRVTPDYIASFARLGYRNLTAEKLVQLKIFKVTPADVRALQARGIAVPSADQLVQRKIGLTVIERNRRGE